MASDNHNTTPKATKFQSFSAKEERKEVLGEGKLGMAAKTTTRSTRLQC
jgi:hypothetical protein